MIKNVLLEGAVEYKPGVLTLQLNRKIAINILAEEACRKVNTFVHMEISTQMHAQPPTLVVGEKAVWRVPVHLTFPSLGDVGSVGFVDVDPVTGALNSSVTTIEEITDNAKHLAARFTSVTKS